MSWTGLVLPSYLVASILFTWPLLRHFTSAIPSSRVALDPCMQAFLLGWDWQSLVRPQALFNLPIFFPEPNALTYMDHLLGEAVLAAPVFALFRSIPAAYNVLFLASFVLSAWGVYRLARLCGISRAAAYLAGFLFAFSPYRFANTDLLNQLQTQFLPLGLFFALRLVQRYRARDLAALAGCFVVQVYFGWYYAYYLVIAVGILIAYAALRRSLDLRRLELWKSAAVAAGALLLVLPVALPYIREHQLLPEFRRSLGESAMYSADVVDYLKWTRSSAVAALVPFATGAQSYWPGLVTVLLGAIGARGIGLRRAAGNARDGMWLRGYFLVLAISSFVLSLGPILHVAGAKIWIPLPYAALYYILPGFSSMRAPARLACLVVLALAVLAGFGYDRLRSGWAGRKAWPGVASLLFLASIALAWPLPLSTVELPSEKELPPVYAWLARQPDRRPVLELPNPRVDADENETHALRQFCLLYHGHPRLDGTSGFVSRRYKEFRSRIQVFPDQEAMRAAREMGAELIIVHFGDYPAAERGVLRSRIQNETRLVPLAEFGTDVVYGFPTGSPLTSSAPPEPTPEIVFHKLPIRRLSPRAFPELPREIVEGLESEGCTIPQIWLDERDMRYGTPHNVIRGSFRRRGQTDWAVLCSRNDSSGIVIFWAGKASDMTELPRSSDEHWTQSIDDRHNLGYSRILMVASPERILENNPDVGPRSRLHDGIEDYFSGKASSIYYIEDGRVLDLMGAD